MSINMSILIGILIIAFIILMGFIQALFLSIYFDNSIYGRSMMGSDEKKAKFKKIKILCMVGSTCILVALSIVYVVYTFDINFGK